ncbi:MAG: LysR family transcriptional regulator [Elainellaceae cyanobacterium]
MDVSVLQLFVDVQRQGSFAAAARDRNIDPSAVSRAIAGLEAELGVRLFQRTTRQLSMTEAGRLYFEQIEPLMEDIQAAAARAKDLSQTPTGTLRVTASNAFGLTCIVPMLPEFERQYPQVAVDLWLTDAVVDLLGDRLDMAVRLGPLPDSSLIAQRLMPTRYRVCASPQYLAQQGHPNHPSEIAQRNGLLFPLAGFRSRWRFRDETGQMNEVPVQGRTTISNAIALRHCAIAGMGLALLADWLIDADLQSGRLIDLFPKYDVTATDFETSAWLLYPSRAYRPLKVNKFAEFLMEQLP